MRKRRVLFSSRVNGTLLPDVLSKTINLKVRNQIVHALINFFGNIRYNTSYINMFLVRAYMHLLEEYGVKVLVFNGNPYHAQDILEWMLNVSDEKFIDALDMIIGSYFEIIDEKRALGIKAYNEFYKHHALHFNSNLNRFEEFLTKINIRFREGGCAYEVDKKGEILLIGNMFAHQEIVKPAIYLINSNSVFKLVEDEFYDAFDDYRNGNFDASMVNSNKAFETTMKIICHERKYSLPKGDKSTCSQLVDCLDSNGYLDDGMAHPLKNGLPVVRNNHSHGQGTVQKQATEYEAMFCLHIMASHINYLIKKF